MITLPAADPTRSATETESAAGGGVRIPSTATGDVPSDRALGRVALRTALIYAVVGGVWIAFSDALVAWFVTDRELAATISVAKGWMFVGVTAVLLYVALGGQLRRWKSEAAARRRAAQALATSEAQLAHALKMAHAGHWEYDVAANLFTFNDHFYQVLRTTAEREGGYTMTPARYAERFLPPGEAHLVADEVRKAIEATDPHYTRELEHPVIFGDGTRGDIAVRIFIVKDAAGRTIRSHGVSQDITERKRSDLALREAEALYRSLVDNIPAGVFRKDVAGRYVFVNDQMCRFNDVPRELLLGRTAAEAATELAARRASSAHPWNQTVAQINRGADHHTLIMQSGQPIILDEDWMAADGRRRCMHTVKTPVFGADGAIIGSQGVLFDITELKQVETALRESEERLQLASSVGGVGTFERNHLTGVMQISSVLREIDGLGDTENRFATLVARMHPEDRATFMAANRRAEDPASDGRVDHEHRLLQPDGSVRWMRVQSHTWFAGEGAGRRAVRTVGTVVDVTRRKLAEAELRANEARYRSLFENILNGFAHCRMEFEDGQPTDFVYLAVNRTFESMTGLKDVVGKNVSTVIPGIREADPQLFELYGRVAKTGAAEKCEIHVTALQQWFDVAVYCPAPGEFVAIFDVITTRKRVEEGLRSLSRAVEQSPVSIIITDAAGAIEYVNPKFTEISGYTLAETKGKNPRILKSGATAPETYREMWDTITAGREWHGELCNRTKGGELYWELASISPVVDDSGRTTRFVAVKENITERRRLEEQLRRAQRMEAIGALSSGIAHDLNNILTPLLLAPALLREFVQGEHELQLLAMIEQNAHRGAEIIRQLLMFSRGSGGERVPVQLRHLLKEVCDIMVETFPREVAVEMNAAAALPLVLGDATQLHQVLLNLCVNARDAMPLGGTLSLRAGAIQFDAGQERLHLDAKPGSYVVIRVTDTGHGILPAIMDHIFDPFFTTKDPGKGTGLGLSTALGIVRSHGGFLNVDSEPGKGSTFSVYLPVAPSGSPAPQREVTPDPPRGRNELILVVDDESSIRAATRLVLESHGYRTLTARGGDEALGIFRLQAAEISLVLTDIMMPGMDGVALIRELRTLRPEVKMMVTTGMASESKQADLAALGITNSLLKPCDRRDLLEAVRGALGP